MKTMVEAERQALTEQYEEEMQVRPRALHAQQLLTCPSITGLTVSPPPPAQVRIRLLQDQLHPHVTHIAEKLAAKDTGGQRSFLKLLPAKDAHSTGDFNVMQKMQVRLAFDSDTPSRAISSGSSTPWHVIISSSNVPSQAISGVSSSSSTPWQPAAAAASVHVRTTLSSSSKHGGLASLSRNQGLLLG